MIYETPTQTNKTLIYIGKLRIAKNIDEISAIFNKLNETHEEQCAFIHALIVSYLAERRSNENLERQLDNAEKYICEHCN